MWQASLETWSWMGVSINKKRACPHLPPLHQTGTAVRPMARPAATRENTTVEPLCRLTDGARLPRADSPATGKHTKPLQKWAEAEPANRSTASTVGTLPSVGIPHGIADAKESHPFTGGRRSTPDRSWGGSRRPTTCSWGREEVAARSPVSRRYSGADTTDGPAGDAVGKRSRLSVSYSTGRTYAVAVASKSATPKRP